MTCSYRVYPVVSVDIIVLYCILRSRGISMRSIVCSFTRDTGFNDVLVHGFICVQ